MITVEAVYGEEHLNQKRLNVLWDKVSIWSHFPEPGVAFVDLAPLMADADARLEMQSYLNSLVDPEDYDVVLGIAVRGVGPAQSLADTHRKPFVLARKPDSNGETKIPPEHTIWIRSTNEYSEDTPLVFDGRLIRAGQRVLIVDDVGATLGTLKATKVAIQNKCGAGVVAAVVIDQLDYLGDKITDPGIPVYAVFHQTVAPELPEDPTVQKRIHCSL